MDDEIYVTARGISGWRRFLTPQYWTWQWRFIRTKGRPLNIISVKTITEADFTPDQWQDLMEAMNG